MTPRWPGRLRVAVPRELEWWSRSTGHGRMWHSVLTILARDVRLHQVNRDGTRGRRPLRAPDVWLADGHEDPPDTQRPLVVQIHEVSWLDPDLREFLPPGLQARLTAKVRASTQRAAHVITPSRWSRRTIVDAGLVPPDRVHAVAHGVDGATFSPEAADPSRVRALAPGLGDRPYVLFAGILSPRKNLAAVREAMAALAAGRPHALVIVGSPPPGRDDAQELAAAAAQPLPGVDRPLAMVDGPGDADLAALMAGASALCLPSFAEGFGLPVLEAMACGTPVVVSDRGALPEVVGEAGVIVAPTAAEVTAGLAGVLDDPELAARLGAAGRERAAGLTWERTAQGWLDVLRHAAAEG